MKPKTMEQCREVAARIWCDKEFEDVTMDTAAAEQIARILYSVSAEQASRQQIADDYLKTAKDAQKG